VVSKIGLQGLGQGLRELVFGDTEQPKDFNSLVTGLEEKAFGQPDTSGGQQRAD
jgi:hypothetical protein